jgi:hypothetical protein
MRYLFSSLNVLAGIVVGFSALNAKWVGCGDEGCRGSTWDWTQNDYSWQWNAIIFLGLAIFGAAVLLAWMMRHSEPGHAVYALTAQAMFAGLLMLIVAGSQFWNPYVALGVFAPALFGAVSVLLQWDAHRSKVSS